MTDKITIDRRTLGSVVSCLVHAMEAISTDGTGLDAFQAVQSWRSDQVQKFVKEAGALAPLPRGKMEFDI